jgi:serine/threonine protein phosphatase PrpC
MGTAASLRFEVGAASHPGRLRAVNEDAYLDHAAAGLWAVADGMGGHDAGQLASRTVVEALHDIAPPVSAAQLLADCEARVVEANARLRQHAAEEGLTIGTTLAVLLTFEALYAAVWSGDSRIYLIRDGALALLSRDHTEVQDLVETGVLTEAERRTWPRRNVITRAIGVGASPELEIVQGGLAEEDRFVLCSDGLTTHVGDPEILARAASAPPQEACDALVGLALERGGLDNVTVLVVRCAGAR